MANPVGRPSKYKPEYCDVLEGHFEQGYSYEAFAGRIGVSKQTLYDWEKAHPEFLDAKRRYEGLTQLFWEGRLIALAKDKDEGNATAIVFGLKNRAPDSWRDRTEQAHSGEVAITKIERQIVDPSD